MNNIIREYIDKMQVIKRESMYMDEDYNQMEFGYVKKDIRRLFDDALIPAYKEFAEKDMDAFITIYAAACNYILVYGLHIAEEIALELFHHFRVEFIKDNELNTCLDLIYNGILTQDKTCFHQAIEVFDCYQMPYYYLFLLNARELDSVDDINMNEYLQMPTYYGKLDEEMCKYLLGESDFNSPNDEMVVFMNLIPFISDESIMADIYRDIIKDFKNSAEIINGEMGTLIGEQEISESDIRDLCMRYVEENSELVDDYRLTFTHMFKCINLMDLDYVKNNIVIGKEHISGMMRSFRKHALGFPYKIKSSKAALKNTLQILELLDEVGKKNSQIRKVEHEKEALINKHAHNWKHIVYPETVKKVAKEMYNRGDMEVANTLFHAYNSQSLLQKDLNLLQLQYASTPEEFSRKFSKSIYTPKDRRGVGIGEVFENAMQIVMFRLVMEGIDQRYTTNEVRDNVFSHYNQQVIRDSYTENFIKEKTDPLTIIQWFSSNFYSLVIENADSWSDVRFKPEGLAYIQMTEVFIDLIHNGLNYGVKSKDGYLKLIFEREDYDGRIVYCCKLKNPVDKDQPLFEGSGQGLKSIQDVMMRLNSYESSKLDYKMTEKSVEMEEFTYAFRIVGNRISKGKVN